MGYFCEGAALARMAELVVRRRLPDDTALGILDEMLSGMDLPGAEFAANEDFPGHPLGDLIVEAFGQGQSFPTLSSLNPWKLYRDGGHVVVNDETLERERDYYFVILRKFTGRYGL